MGVTCAFLQEHNREGHDFSRADRAPREDAALAAEGILFAA